MRMVVSGRAGGKTYAGLHWLAADPEHRVMVVLSERDAQYLLVEAQRLFPNDGITAQNFVGYHQALGGSMRGRNVRVLVDNADVMLRELLGDVEVMTASATVDSPGLFMEGWR